MGAQKRSSQKDEKLKAGQSALEAELASQLQEVSRLLVRVLKAMRFSNSQIISAVSNACELERPKPVRRPTAGRGELWGNVLCRWMEDPRFVDDFGQPKLIPVKGHSCSFATLVRETLPDADVQECLEGLIKMNSVVRMGSSRVRLRSSTTIYSGNDATFVEGVLLSVRELLRTVAWNLLATRNADQPRLFQRGVTGVEISKDDFDVLLRMVTTHGMSLLELFNAWVNQHAVKAATTKQRSQTSNVQPYIGIYLSSGKDAKSPK
jgi:Family of unknown function (DUF6502)